MSFDLLYQLATTKNFKKSIKTLNNEEIDFIWNSLKSICPEKRQEGKTSLVCLCRSPFFFQSLIVAITLFAIQTCLNREILENGQGDESD